VVCSSVRHQARVSEQLQLRSSAQIFTVCAPNQTSFEHRCDEASYNNQGWHINTSGELSRGSRMLMQ